MKNSLLNNEKDELNKLIMEQTQQLTGTEQFTSNLHSPPVMDTLKTN